MTKARQNHAWISRVLRSVSALALAALGLAVVVVPSAHAQTFSVLYTFTNIPADGANPYAGLVLDSSGNLYGTTEDGGSGLWCPSGCGTVFKVDTSGTQTVLHNFGTDGGFPYGGLVRDSAGNLYGTTSERGSGTSCPYGCGTVFKVDKSGKETVLYSFVGGPTDGEYPLAGVVRDTSGNLYGTTLTGGTSNLGTIFKIDSSGNESVLHNFTGPPTDGSFPYAGLIRDGAGNLYGTTYVGGANGVGSVFKLAPNGTFTLLHSFSFNGGDGQFPYSALVRDSKGNLYGTTLLGGNLGSGTVFKVDTKSNETVHYNFGYSPDGGYPQGSLTLDAAGNLYGTTEQGGDPVCLCGTVFKITPATGN